MTSNDWEYYLLHEPADPFGDHSPLTRLHLSRVARIGSFRLEALKVRRSNALHDFMQSETLVSSQRHNSSNATVQAFSCLDRPQEFNGHDALNDFPNKGGYSSWCRVRR